MCFFSCNWWCRWPNVCVCVSLSPFPDAICNHWWLCCSVLQSRAGLCSCLGSHRGPEASAEHHREEGPQHGEEKGSRLAVRDPPPDVTCAYNAAKQTNERRNITIHARIRRKAYRSRLYEVLLLARPEEHKRRSITVSLYGTQGLVPAQRCSCEHRALECENTFRMNWDASWAPRHSCITTLTLL